MNYCTTCQRTKCTCYVPFPSPNLCWANNAFKGDGQGGIIIDTHITDYMLVILRNLIENEQVERKNLAKGAAKRKLVVANKELILEILKDYSSKVYGDSTSATIFVEKLINSTK